MLAHDKDARELLRTVTHEVPVFQTAAGKFRKGSVLDGQLRAMAEVEAMQQQLRAAAEAEEAAKGSDGRRVSTRDDVEAAHGRVPKAKLDGRDWMETGFIAFLAVAVVIIMTIWAQMGLLGDDHLGHHITVKTRAGHMTSPMYVTPADISLEGTEGALKEFFEVRLILMAAKDFSQADHHRRLEALRARWRPRPARWPWEPQFRQLAGSDNHDDNITGNVTYQLLADGEVFFEKTVELASDREVEHFQTVDVIELGKNQAQEFSARVVGERSDHTESAFMLQVVRMGASGKYREVIGVIIFVITFAGIVSELIHRTYNAMLGASACLACLSALQETPHLHTVTGMVDFGTLMLLFSMMILMRMLAVTGFFNWFAMKTVIMSREDPKVLFFALTNICGVLSMVLDNVTCVLLFGPLTFNLAKKMSINPRYLYLSMTIVATIGGTATYIGDPPNIVIGSKMKLGFEDFLIYNFPIVITLFLPISSSFLWWRVKDMIQSREALEKKEKLDYDKLRSDNRITDPVMFAKLSAVLCAVLLSLLLSPLHKIEPAWFTVMAMFACAILFERHKFGNYLEFVEWDTLFFFAILFVLVECLAELGVIRALGEGIIAFIKVFPVESRMGVAVITILWTSSLGSAFLESLPYTTTIVYVLIDLQNQTIEGVSPSVLVWPLSVGACVGGIGSIMGSSANLVCMAVSERYGELDEEKVQGGDFLRYGLPTLGVLTVITTAWQLILFVACEIVP